MYKNSTIYTICAITLFIATVVTANTHGLNNRKIKPGSATHIISSSDQAYTFWQEMGVKGRTLLLFDNYPHSRGRLNYDGAPRLNSSNFVEYGVFNNVLRRVYFIVPDAKWEQFRQQETMMNPIREAVTLERGVYLFNLNGIPLIAVPLSSLPHLDEKPLIYINSAEFNVAGTLQQLALKKITSDCIISLERGER